MEVLPDRRNSARRGAEDDSVVAPLAVAQIFAGKSAQYRKLYVLALTNPKTAFGRRNPKR